MTILPEEIRQIQVHTDAMAIYTKVGLESYFSLPAWGMDVQKACQLITTLQDDGSASIQDVQGQEMIVNINEETIRDALMIPIGNQSLMVRNSTQEITDTFMQMGESNFTFKDLIQGSVELPLRLYTQHFTHGKASRYTRPHRRIAAMLTKAVNSRHRLSLNFAEVILTEMKAYANRLRASKEKISHMNCALMLTRIAYFAVGLIEELPPSQPLKQWLE